jgi:hypothetical protein
MIMLFNLNCTRTSAASLLRHGACAPARGPGPLRAGAGRRRCVDPPPAALRILREWQRRLTAIRGSDSIDVAPKTLQHRFPQTPPLAVLQSDASAGSAVDKRPFGGRSPRVLCRVFGSRHQRRPLARPEKPHTGVFNAKRQLRDAGEICRRYAAESARR